MDMTDRAFVTVDNDHSMDLDQAYHPTLYGSLSIFSNNVALSLFKAMHIAPSIKGGRAYGGFVVSYALADGAFYVPAGSPMFDESLKRNGTSYYMPGLCVPMLPRALSEDLMSLNEG